jgi:hypothetical protein
MRSFLGGATLGSVFTVRESDLAAGGDCKKPSGRIYDFVEPGPGDNFEFGINYKACGFCKFAARQGDQEILPHICGLDFEAYATRGIQLERTQTLAGGASHCNFRFSRLEPR